MILMTRLGFSDKFFYRYFISFEIFIRYTSNVFQQNFRYVNRHRIEKMLQLRLGRLSVYVHMEHILSKVQDKNFCLLDIFYQSLDSNFEICNIYLNWTMKIYISKF